MTINEPEKIEWRGTIVSVQPRTTVWRYKLDNRTHYHRGTRTIRRLRLDRNDSPDFLKTLTHKLCSDSRFITDYNAKLDSEDDVESGIFCPEAH